jgi:TonB family protein
MELVVVEKQKAGGLSLSVVISLVLHSLFVLWVMQSYRPVTTVSDEAPIARYVELIKQNPQTFTEAPGPKIDRAPLSAPLSDANRKASMPEPTGDRPTNRPGDGSGIYSPPMGQPAPPARPPSPAVQPVAPVQGQQANTSFDERGSETSNAQPADGLIYRQSSGAQSSPQSAAQNAVDWRSAIREAGKVASLGGEGFDLGQLGGEKGFAEQGPLSFETQWFDWGDYAQSMVSRIRVNWYANMPQLIRSGIQGVVTIRFTIERSGRISAVEILNSSGHPPYDFAARKAIELSSPLNALPVNFPGERERVTAMFYYNMQIPRR